MFVLILRGEGEQRLGYKAGREKESARLIEKSAHVPPPDPDPFIPNHHDRVPLRPTKICRPKIPRCAERLGSRLG